MDNRIVNGIYDTLKSKLNLENGPYTHSDIVENTKFISNFVFRCDDRRVIDFVVAKFEENHPSVLVREPDILSNNPSAGAWFEEKKIILSERLREGYFNRYRSYLRREDFNDAVIDRIEGDCERILKQCANPELTIDMSERKKKGLVVGDVQSGKTANYIGLINLACDYGYNIIVLLAGMTDSLRQQTQKRIDQGFIGAISDTIGSSEITYVGVTEGEDYKQHHAVPLTNNENDFLKFVSKNLNATTGDFNKPIILVVKKNSSVLEGLCGWLKSGKNNITSQNILIIDDEADNASINTKKSSTAPSTINQYIRNLFNNFPIATYVGFTATPFANVFINPDGEENYKDLFPSDFIVLLHAPSNYFGATKVFSYDGDDEQSRYIRELDESEMYFLPVKHKKNETHFRNIPASMKEAILCFLINNVIMTLKGKNEKHRSMLINITVFNNLHEEIKGVVEDYIRYLRAIIEQDSFKPTSSFIQNVEMNKLYSIYHGAPETLVNGIDFYQEFRNLYSWQEIQNGLYDEIKKFEVAIFNNKSKKNRFSYDDGKFKNDGARVIAIGGYVLSRGLTLEGLMISYYSRNSAAYDSLLQMCRWFGYRPGYENLCRIYISKVNIMNFRAVIDALENLKLQFQELVIKKKKPIDFGLMVKESPDSLNTSLLITSRNKTYNSGKIIHYLNYGGIYADTSKLYCDKSINLENIQIIKEMLVKISGLKEDYSSSKMKQEHSMYRNVDKSIISDVIINLKIPYINTKFDTDNLSEYIQKSITFTKWDVAIASGDSSIKYMDRYAVKRSFRKRKEEKFVRIGNSNNRIIDPNHFGFGLTEEQLKTVARHAKERVTRAGKGDENNYTVLDYLSPEDRNPLFIIYPMELKVPEEQNKDAQNKDEQNKEEKDFMAYFGYTEPLLGFAIGFPMVESSEKLVYRANKIKIREIEAQRGDFEEDEEVLDYD